MSELSVTPGELRGTSNRLGDAADEMKGILSSLKSELAVKGPAWGSDEFGSQFTEGEGGYLAQAEWVNGSIDAKVALLERYSEILRRAADTLEQQDQS